MKVRMEFTRSDWILIALGLFLVTGSSYFYFGEHSLRNYLAQYFPSFRQTSFNEKVGVIKIEKGTVRRQQAGKADFERISNNAHLFNSDTLVTSRDTGAVVEFNDGEKLELGPGTMIRLQLESKVSFEGITRIATLDLISGEVKGTSNRQTNVRTIKGGLVNLTKAPEQKVVVDRVMIVKPTAKPQALTTVMDAKTGFDMTRAEPSPEPPPVVEPSPVPVETPKAVEAPLTLEFKTPAAGVRYEVPKGSSTPGVSVEVEFTASQEALPSKLSVFRMKGAEKEAVLEREQTGEGMLTRASIPIEAPGKYILEVAAKDQKKQIPFQVAPEFEGIALESPLIGGSAIRSNEYQGKPIKNFEIVLRWKPFPGVKTYFVELFDAATNKSLLKRKVEEAEYRFNKNVVFMGRFKYQVTAALKSGFKPISAFNLFEFSFLPPELTQPTDGTKVTSRGSVLLTWMKTNFTQTYELEVFSDADLKTKVFTKKIPENFYVLKGMQAGSLWWRVRSISGTTTSPFSKAASFTIQ